jgi:tetratricopeptide (TPR) repeat protein
LKKKQIILSISGILLIAAIFLLGKTVSNQKPENPSIASEKKQLFDIQDFIKKSTVNISNSQRSALAILENEIKNETELSKKIITLNTLASYWKDTLKQFEPYAFYISEAAKLDNSEKNLTFAAQLFLSELRHEQDESKLAWESDEAIALFNKAIEINPANEDLKIGLGSCYVFGKGRNGDPQQTMTGIQELLGVVRRDSTNMKAQIVLGIGGYISGQYDKAISRFQKVIINEPNNLEAIAFLADTYAAQGNKTEAIKWYNISKRLANDENYTKEVDERIKLLEK